MPKTSDAASLQCMNCGAPIKSGFFCAKCQSGENDDLEIKGKDKGDTWKGSRFSGEAKKKKQRALLMEELTTWGKRLLIVLILVGVGFGVKTFFGRRIINWYESARGATNPREKYDPTKDPNANVDSKGDPNGTRAFVKAHDQ
jgi:hypothetical protein